ncbi:head decoration protein [Limisalsivibrio acetivorans]|uniref:head decoration protein n=1 Tax=Limisalsivibrio acetivorans TaxID=1304888 RepID=UPI0003B6C82D|nr:head decoration protein [Limisalsivibrio acetivorans]
MSMSLYENDTLVSAQRIPIMRSVVIASGEVLEKGSVLGRITATGKYVLSESASADGSESPDVVLASAVDASTGDTAADVYIAGAFIDKALKFGAGHTAESTWHGLRAKSIYIMRGV